MSSCWVGRTSLPKGFAPPPHGAQKAARRAGSVQDYSPARRRVPKPNFAQIGPNLAEVASTWPSSGKTCQFSTHVGPSRGRGARQYAVLHASVTHFGLQREVVSPEKVHGPRSATKITRHRLPVLHVPWICGMPHHVFWMLRTSNISKRKRLWRTRLTSTASPKTQQPYRFRRPRSCNEPLAARLPERCSNLPPKATLERSPPIGRTTLTPHAQNCGPQSATQRPHAGCVCQNLTGGAMLAKLGRRQANELALHC